MYFLGINRNLEMEITDQGTKNGKYFLDHFKYLIVSHFTAVKDGDFSVLLSISSFFSKMLYQIDNLKLYLAKQIN